MTQYLFTKLKELTGCIHTHITKSKSNPCIPVVVAASTEVAKEKDEA
ncbi:DUF1381 domain-containing protein, partial [Staphylococcus aureus]